MGATVRWDGLSGVARGSLCVGLGGVTRGPLPFLTTVLPPIFIEGMAFLLSDAMFGERIVMDDSLYHIIKRGCAPPLRAVGVLGELGVVEVGVDGD